MKVNVSLALTWLLTQESLLRQGDADAPNRLLFSARSFYACGLLVNNSG